MWCTILHCYRDIRAENLPKENNEWKNKGEHFFSKQEPKHYICIDYARFEPNVIKFEKLFMDCLKKYEKSQI